MTVTESPLDAHLAGLAAALPGFRRTAGRLAGWGETLARLLFTGGRLLVAGNGGSAAEAQHLTAELVGKLRADRMPLSAIALTAETSSLTAIGNDYGFTELFARQVRAHGRPGDILLLLSTSGRSDNLLAAAAAARDVGMLRWAFTGPAPNPLADACCDAVAVPAPDPQVVQELHLVCTHVLCEYVDRFLPVVAGEDGERPPVTGRLNGHRTPDGRAVPGVTGPAVPEMDNQEAPEPAGRVLVRPGRPAGGGR